MKKLAKKLIATALVAVFMLGVLSATVTVLANEPEVTIITGDNIYEQVSRLFPNWDERQILLNDVEQERGFSFSESMAFRASEEPRMILKSYFQNAGSVLRIPLDAGETTDWFIIRPAGMEIIPLEIEIYTDEALDWYRTGNLELITTPPFDGAYPVNAVWIANRDDLIFVSVRQGSNGLMLIAESVGNPIINADGFSFFHIADHWTARGALNVLVASEFNADTFAMQMGATPTTTITPASNTIAVNVNGQPVNFTDQQPTIIDGRTLVPVRGVFETLGFDVSWNQEARQVTLSRANDTIIITIDSATFTINGESHPLDVPAQIIGGSTMLPIRAVLESVGYELKWDGNTRTVVIRSHL